MDKMSLKWKRLLDNRDLFDTEISIIQALMNLESEGGRCPKCLKEWIEVEKETQFSYMKYYNPNCYCFVRCPLCGKSLHYEDFSGDLKSGKCGKQGYRRKSNMCYCGHLIKDDKKRIRYWGLSFERKNFDLLNKIRKRKNIYYENPDGTFVMERE